MLTALLFTVLSQVPGQYRAFVIDCHDGDTCKLDIQEPMRSVLGFDVMLTHHETMRFCGINAPELSTGAPGKATKDYVLARIRAAKLIEVKPSMRNAMAQRDKYGRFLGWLLVDGVDLNAELVTKGLAVKYIECQ